MEGIPAVICQQQTNINLNNNTKTPLLIPISFSSLSLSLSIKILQLNSVSVSWKCTQKTLIIWSFKTTTVTSDLWLRVSDDLTAEGDRHALKHFEVLEFVVEERRHAVPQQVVVVLDVIVTLLHWGAFQPKLNLTDQPLLEA